MRAWVALVLISLLVNRSRGADVFTDQVRPILAAHCFKCHGPDDKARKAKLRLDVRDLAIEKGAIDPGKPDASELVRRIFTHDDEQMPPASAKSPLTEKQKQILKDWISAGAEYKLHWAFVAPKRLTPPRPVPNPIDAFVLARLEKEGLRPAPPADKYTLVRRIYLDLIGLPPTPEEVDAFVNDKAADAYEKLVDRLMQSPHYGERWARRWLDLARYADTNGYEKDRPRSIWPYRDWVIEALNADMPFDRFTIEQLAGDMLPNTTEAQRIATGFHRNTMLNEEGGIDPLEFRFHAMTDRVATTGTIWLGLTLGCAQCHTHKFDPVPQREYYQLMAFLNNADEPMMDVHRPEVATKRQEIDARIAGLIAALPQKFPADPAKKEEGGQAHLNRKFAEWLKRESERSNRWTILRPTKAASNVPLLTVQPDDSIFVSGDMTKLDTYELSFSSDVKGITAIRLEALPDDRLPNHGPGRIYYEGPIGDFHLSEFSVAASGKPVKIAKATHSFAAGNATAQAAIDGNPQTGWGINGRQGQAHVAVFQFAEPLADASEIGVRMLFERYYAAGLGRFRISVTKDPNATARDLPTAVEELLLVPEEKRTSAQNERLMSQFLLSAPELAKERAEIDALRKQRGTFPTTLVMQERPPENPRPTYMHHRGEYLQPTERVEPDVLSFLPPLSKDAPRNRLSFARWLVSSENPLTARVTVNRHWQTFFGTGLVRTTQDFGYTGEAPSHPELLDWLAMEFMQPTKPTDGAPVGSAWSLKRLHRMIVTSQTYRQASRVTPELLAKDPDNRLLTRGPRIRLEAELIRDSVLRASGLLSTKLGGPSVFPPQPPGVTTEGAYGRLDWKVSEGPDRYRRGLYTFMKRTTPYAMFSTFDGPSGEFCLARREVSNTPLQALTLLNDPVFTEAAQALGKKMALSEGTIEERVSFLFRSMLTRPPTKSESHALVGYLLKQKARFERKELDAMKILGAAEGDASERAAWTVLARSILNLDEMVTRP